MIPREMPPIEAVLAELLTPALFRRWLEAYASYRLSGWHYLERYIGAALGEHADGVTLFEAPAEQTIACLVMASGAAESRWYPLPGWAVAFLRLTMRAGGEAPPIFPDVAIEYLAMPGDEMARAFQTIYGHVPAMTLEGQVLPHAVTAQAEYFIQAAGSASRRQHRGVHAGWREVAKRPTSPAHSCRDGTGRHPSVDAAPAAVRPALQP